MLRHKSLQSCPTLCNTMDCSPPGFSLHGILQARILEWVPFPPPGILPEIETISLMSPALSGRFLTLVSPGSTERLGFQKYFSSEVLGLRE